MELLQIEKPILHILICINDRSHLPEPKKPDCGPKIDLDKLKEIRKKYKTKGVKITQTKCLGICPKEGFIVMSYPKGEYFQLNNISEIEDLIKLELNLEN